MSLSLFIQISIFICKLLKEFRDKDAANNIYTFHGLDQHLCASDYKTNEKGKGSWGIIKLLGQPNFFYYF